MGRKRINPLGYEQITQQAEKTMTMLMKPALVKTNSEATKDQAVTRAFGAFMLWKDLTASYPDTKADESRLFEILTSWQDKAP